MTGIINNKWFYSLKEERWGSLFRSIPRCVVSQHFPVYRIVNERREYAVFTSVLSFFYFYMDQPSPKEYHEVILGEKEQRPRFDLDIPYETYVRSKHLRKIICRDETEESPEWMAIFGDRLVELIIDAVKIVLKEYKLDLDPVTDIGFYTSHSLQEKPYKYSAHIIFHNLTHYNYEEAKEFYRLVISENLNLHIAEKAGIIDASIYASLKSFRIMGSCKDGKRTKVRDILTYEGHDYAPEDAKTTKEAIKIFRRSCITDATMGRYIPLILPDKKIYTDKVKLPPEAEDAILPHLDDNFVIEEIKGGLIVLRRVRSSYCKMCKRDHESDNPFLTVKKNGDVHFHCRRSGTSYSMCVIKGVSTVEGTEKSIPVGRTNLSQKKRSESSSDDESEEDVSEYSVTSPKQKKKTPMRMGINFNKLDDLSYEVKSKPLPTQVIRNGKRIKKKVSYEEYIGLLQMGDEFL